jgi:hypothetical protein
LVPCHKPDDSGQHGHLVGRLLATATDEAVVWGGKRLLHPELLLESLDEVVGLGVHVLVDALQVNGNGESVTRSCLLALNHS